MSNYSDLLLIIKMRVCQNNGMPTSSMSGKNNYRVNQVWHRIEQIFVLECILDEYRKKYGSPHSPLENEKALHHMILEITKWSLPEIRALSFNDSMFIISERLRRENMHPDAQGYLNSLDFPATSYPLDEFSEKDWDPKGDSIYLQSRT
ncbi:ECs1072 family phage-associated protein [Xenorhabdus entomophaga]|uniref:ECs1072 family phage-associated protein n=1 Tax=Xenorhabdus entomophaga TaxID=3136257 RepID=UPI0030F39F55